MTLKMFEGIIANKISNWFTQSTAVNFIDESSVLK